MEAPETAAQALGLTTVQPDLLHLQQAQQQQQQAAANRILFLVVVSGADLDTLEDPRPTGPRYTRDSLRNLLQLLGCKPRLAYKVMLAVFQAVDTAVTTARQQRISRKTFQVSTFRFVVVVVHGDGDIESICRTSPARAWQLQRFTQD
jgi:hypothetical protein